MRQLRQHERLLGFLLTPALFFIGVPPAVAVGSHAPQILATSVSSLDQQWRRGNVDLRMGITLLAGGLAGSALGVQVFGYLKSIGQIDVVIALAFIIMLSSMGGLMLAESSRTILRHKLKNPVVRRKLQQHYRVARWPLKVRYPKSRLYVSIFLPLLLGMGGGLLSAIMGIGGGFLLVPAMIYLIGMPTPVVVGTSLFQIIFVSANVTFLQSWTHQSVDIVLAAAVTIGGLIGSPYGARLGTKLKADQMRGLMALLVLAVAIELGVGLVVTPGELYSTEMTVLSDTAGGGQ